jgi:peptide/nickel transport system substrate-binding protein
MAEFGNPGASTAAPISVARQGGKFTMGVGGSLDQTDPQRAIDLTNLHTNRLYTEGLLDYDDQLNPMPGLIEEWGTSEDGRVYTLRLREGIKFHNGREMTMDDLLWNLNRMVDLRAVSGSGGSLVSLEKENIKALDAHTVQLTLTEPYAPFLGLLSCGWSVYIIAPESPSNTVGDVNTVTRGIGTGPYELVEYKPKDVVRLRKFADNWRGFTEGFDEIEIRNMSDDAVRVTALRAGDVDFINLVPDSELDLLQTQEAANIETQIYPEGLFWFFTFNHTREPFTDPNVRKALQLAFDGAQVAEAVALGHGAPYLQPWTKESRWYYDKVELPKRDVAQARQLLADAGHSSGLAFKLLISSSWFTNMSIAAQVLQAQFAEIGVQLEVENVDFSTMLDKGLNLDYDMIDTSWDIEPWDPDDYYFNCYHPKGFAWKLQGGGIDNKALHTALERARTEQDFATRKTMYQDIEILLNREAVGIYGYRQSQAFAWNKAFAGFKTSVRGDLAYATGGVYAITRV